MPTFKYTVYGRCGEEYNNNNKRKLRGVQPLGAINVITNASFDSPSLCLSLYRRRLTTLTSFRFPVSLVMILSKVLTPSTSFTTSPSWYCATGILYYKYSHATKYDNIVLLLFAYIVFGTYTCIKYTLDYRTR